MPQAFPLQTDPPQDVNVAGLDQNCYFCTIAALLGMTTHDLVAHAQTMQQDTATVDEIRALMESAGIHNPVAENFSNEAGVSAALNTLPNGYGVGLAYARSNGTGHMIVACRDAHGTGGFIDYQHTPPQATPHFPEDINQITAMHLFYRA